MKDAKEALAARKAAGVKLGRPQGKAKNLKLDVRKDEIQKYINIEVSKAAIAKIIGCPATTLYDYCKARKLEGKGKV